VEEVGDENECCFCYRGSEASKHKIREATEKQVWQKKARVLQATGRMRRHKHLQVGAGDSSEMAAAQPPRKPAKAPTRGTARRHPAPAGTRNAPAGAARTGTRGYRRRREQQRRCHRERHSPPFKKALCYTKKGVIPSEEVRRYAPARSRCRGMSRGGASRCVRDSRTKGREEVAERRAEEGGGGEVW